ncbi:MAG: PAS domain S-box protein [Bacteroidales bacterium]|nr:PAS domain S-box protein [Bacteroidales bacterium]
MNKKPSYTELVKKNKLLEQENRHLKKLQNKYQYSHSNMHAVKLESHAAKKDHEEKSIQSYYEIFNSVPELIFICDVNTCKIIDINHAVSDLLGYTYDELLHQGIDDLSASESASEKNKLLCRINEANKGKNQNFIWHVKRKDGSTVWLETTLKYIDLTGISRILAVARNIPEHKKSEEDSQQAADIFNNIQSGIHIYELEDLNDDSTLRMIAANPATEKLTGVPVNKVIGKTLDENFPGLRSKGVPQKYAEVVRTGNSYEIEDIRYSDERVVAGAFSVKAFPLPKNRVGVSFENITEKKKAEEELLNFTKYLKGIINASPSVIYTYNLRNNKVTYISEKIKDFAGYTPEEILRMKNVIKRFMYKEDLHSLLKYLDNIKQLVIEEVSNLELRIVKKDGIVIWTSIALIIYERDDHDLPVQLIGTISEITKRKEAELALKRSEENYRLIVEGQSDMIIKFDTQNIVQFVSPSYCDKFGVTEEELIGKQYQPLIHEDYRLKTSSLMEDLKNPPYMSYVEQREMTKDGWRWLAWTQKALLNEDGSINEIIGVASDITDRKIAENALMESEERYRTLFEQAADGILIENPEGDIIDLNKNMTKITGYEKEDLFGKKKDILFDTSELILKPGRYGQLKSGAETISEHKIVRKDGTVIDVEIKAKQLADGRLHALFRDITERKKSEKALIESEQKYRLLFETANDAIFMMSKDTFIDCNSATLKIYGCTRKQIIGQTPFRFSPETQPDGKNSKIRALEKINDALNVGPQFFEWQHIRYDGTPFDAEVSLKKTEFSGTTYLQAIVRDITDRKAAENALRERESQLAEANQMLELILNTIPVRVFWKDKDFKYLGCNKLFAADAGYDDPKFLKGKTDYDLTWKEQADLYRSYDLKIISSSDPIMNIEEPESTPNGDIIWLKTNKIQLRNVHGDTIGILGTYEDITEKKMSEKALLESEAKFRNIFNSSSDGIVITDLNENVIEANEAFLEKTGYDRSIIQNTSYLNFIEKGNHETIKERIKSLDKKLKSPSVEVNIITEQGHIFPAEINSKLIDYQDKKAILSVIRDMTERKQIEKKILEAIIMTEEKEREKFAKNLHDDLGPLLSSIKMYVNSILNTNSLEKQQFIVERLNEIAKEAIQSTKEISNDLSPHILKNYGLLAAIESFSRKVEDHVRILVKSNLTDDRFSEEIETSLYRIIKELVNNTIKHANASHIEIELVKETEGICLIFKDDGTGFDPEIIEKKVSAGMGLSNIISRIRSLKGNYSMISAINNGFEFNLDIPFSG